jgi:hypothetical protein
MKSILIIGVTLIVMGAAVLGYNHYSYTTTEQVLQVGPITATAERTHTVFLPPILGWLLIAGGACALIFGARSKKD